MSDKKNQKRNKVAFIVVGSGLTAAGFAVIPVLIKKYGNKAYKNSINTEQIDFDVMGPEIIPFDKKQEEFDK